MIQPNIYKDLDLMTEVAKLKAKEHSCNYNIIILNPVDGEFDITCSTYEMVANSYFNKERPNCVLLHKTDDLLEVKDMVEVFDGPTDVDPFDNNPSYEIISTHDDTRYYDKNKGVHPNTQAVRKEPKISRNTLCPCNSGKKYKKCCIN